MTGGAPPPAPGAGDRMERAVAFINARADVIESEIIAIGTYLLREFFDDDPREVAATHLPGRYGIHGLTGWMTRASVAT
jgi:hypothetical protein